MASISKVHLEYSDKRKRAKLTWTSGVLQEFDLGDNWESYSEKLNHYFASESIPDNEQVAVLLTVISPAVYQVLKDSCIPELPRLKTFAYLSKILEMHSQQGYVFKERFKFHEATQADDENINQWLSRVTNLINSCEFRELRDTMLKDKFISGLNDQRIVSRLCLENSKATLTMDHIVNIAVEMASTAERTTSILEMPNEILEKIILNLNARERVPLGNSCQRFHSLVFTDEKLLRVLDFSNEGRLTSLPDIQQYFHDEDTSKLIRTVNIRNVRCMRPGNMLNDSIGKAINLVDICIHGIVFKDIWQLGSFLNPLPHVRRLSIDWHLTVDHDISLCDKLLEKPFGRLTYLSVVVKLGVIRRFLLSLQLCQNLKELHMEVDTSDLDYSDFGTEELKKLQSLKIIKYWGPWADGLKERFVTMLPNLSKWTEYDFNSCRYLHPFYLGELNSKEVLSEKDMDICKELMRGKWMEFVPSDEWNDLNLGWALFPELLLNEVLRITHENVPDKFCCLSTFNVGERCLLDIEDAKRLLINPKHQISSLSINHDIERGCDLHLIASAFPNITKLHIFNVIKSTISNRNQPHVKGYLSKKNCAVPEEQDDFMNLDSSFKKLVDHTPRVIDLTLSAEFLESKDWCWDLDALYLIPGWKCLETLQLWHIPIEHGGFLIEIGKQCKHLQKLMLTDLGPDCVWCYKEGLFQMLRHCRNLREFSIEQDNMSHISEMLTLLSNNLQLRRVSVNTIIIKSTIFEFVSSIKQLLRCCPKLTTFICQIEHKTSADHDLLSSHVQRLKDEFSLRNLQIQVAYRKPDDDIVEIGTIHEDAPGPKSYYP